jgi:hypothetical protein
MQLIIPELDCWLSPEGGVVTLFVNAAAIKLLMKKTSAMATKRRSMSCDLLRAVLIIAQ